MATTLTCFAGSLQAEILPQAELALKFGLANKSTTRPMTVAYIPSHKKYYIADGGLAPMGSETEAPISKSLIHSYDETGKYVNSSRPGYDNRSIYFNTNTNKLETITYNVSSDVGFSPNTGIYAINLTETGELKDTSDEISQFNPAFGHSGTMPSYDAANQRYFAKQGRSDKVFIVDPTKREKIGEIKLDLAKAGVAHDDISDLFAAYTGIQGEELLLLDIDHKAILVFSIDGQYVGKSELPKELKLRANNHYTGLGYANQLFFVFHEPEGEFGTYYAFKVQK
ncbi:MAG: hypothetical protein V9G21_09035 [Methylotenera sp.]|nr:hypothetical protein [Methylotenera sp.]HOY86638.1 hypothetical protein [Methylotenera sp.]HPH08696.1 hypothetical protein [Methylotenera sp.]HPM48980.1 hypothetical protein [Methylotenera sp.]HPV32831.1 hypothetical protein [Methylotenera sp.]